MSLLLAARRVATGFGRAATGVGAVLCRSDLSSSSKAPGHIAERLAWFSSGTLVTPRLRPERQELMQHIYTQTQKESYEQHLCESAPEPLIAKDLPTYERVGGNVYQEAAVEINLSPDSDAMRVVKHTNIGFYRPSYGNNRKPILNDFKTLFTISDQKAEALLDFLIEMEEQFRADHKLTVFTPVEISAHTILQVVKGPVTADTVLLPEHVDRPNSAHQATVHYRGSESAASPFHKVVFNLPDGTKRDMGSGFFVSNHVSHSVQSSRDLPPGETGSTSSIAFVFAVKSGFSWIKA